MHILFLSHRFYPDVGGTESEFGDLGDPLRGFWPRRSLGDLVGM